MSRMHMTSRCLLCCSEEACEMCSLADQQKGLDSSMLQLPLAGAVSSTLMGGGGSPNTIAGF